MSLLRYGWSLKLIASAVGWRRLNKYQGTAPEKTLAYPPVFLVSEALGLFKELDYYFNRSLSVNRVHQLEERRK